MRRMTKSRMAILIHDQTIRVSCAVEDCLTPRTTVEDKIHARLGIRPITDYNGIPENLRPYIEAYWDICYRFLQEEKKLLEQMINDLFAEEGDRELKEALKAIDYIDRRLDDMKEAAVFVGLKSEN